MSDTMRKQSIAEAERRSSETQSARELKNELNIDQLAALHLLEQFGWYLKFIRRNPPKPPIAVLCDPDARKYALLDEHGELRENPVFEQFR